MYQSLVTSPDVNRHIDYPISDSPHAIQGLLGGGRKPCELNGKLGSP